MVKGRRAPTQDPSTHLDVVAHGGGAQYHGVVAPLCLEVLELGGVVQTRVRQNDVGGSP